MYSLRSSGFDASPADASMPRTARLFTLPSLCAVCHQWGRERVCGMCIDRYAQRVSRCERCAIEVPSGVSVCGKCIAHPPPYDHALTAVDYAFPWDGLITRFKFHDALDLTGTFAQRIVNAHRASSLPMPTLMIPVPLSAQRLRTRGYNQAWELTRRVARTLKCRAAHDVLLRVRDTPHQIDLPIDDRADNIRGAFAIEPARRSEVRGQTVAIIDDVVTTGATSAEAARVLRECGAAHVQVWSLARTPRPGS